MDHDQEKQLKEEQEKKKQKMSRIARMKYMEEKETLQKKSYTSFGKLILAKEKTAPTFSIGQAHRFANAGEAVTLPKNTPGPDYNVNDKFKFKSDSKWKIGTGARPPIHRGEKFDHYDHAYDEKFDFSKNPKKWGKTRGGAMSLEPRIKYDFREGIPGPGRYEPDIKPIKPHAPTYYLGEKTNFNSLELLTGTNDIVGPGHYAVQDSKKTSKHIDPPKFSIGKDERKGLNYKTWTKNETYHLYSSVGSQIMTQKRTEPQINMGKSSRDKVKKLGMFPSMMSKQPSKIRIDHPKF